MHINKYFLELLLSPLVGSGDIDEDVEKYRHTNSNEKAQIELIINEVIKPKYLLRNDFQRQMIKLTLSYFLTSDELDFGSFFDSLLIAFDHPNPPKNFFLWIWMVLFQNEDFNLKDWKDYIIKDDENEIFIKP